MIFYDGINDLTIKFSNLIVSLRNGYFYEKENGGCCVPVSIECTDTTDIYQYCNIEDYFGAIHLGYKESDIYKTFNGVLHFVKNDPGQCCVKIITGCSINGNRFSEEHIICLIELPLISLEENIRRAKDCYQSLEFLLLFKKWRAHYYIPEINVLDMITNHLEMMGGEYINRFYLNNEDYPCCFVWEGNQYQIKSKSLGRMIKLEKVLRCISSEAGSAFDSDDRLVFSIIIASNDAPYNVKPEKTLESSAYWGVNTDSNPARFLVRYDAEETLKGEANISCAEFTINGQNVIVLLENSSGMEIRECPYYYDACTPWNEEVSVETLQ